MTRQEFESLYLGKKVKLTMFYDEILIGELHNTQEKRFKNDPDLHYRYNFYTLLPHSNFIFRKSHIKKIEVLN